ncbi:MAG: FHA domain-containing protein [Saccharofermentanales bacterium]|jgi:hypothetical protein|nr:FHA domain-containing protein [Clostridiaceae bacterium]
MNTTMDIALHKETDSFASHLIRPLAQDEYIVQYQLHLLLRHRPPGLLACGIRSRKSTCEVCWDISEVIELEQIIKTTQIERGKALAILARMVSILIDSDDRLLPAGQFVLDSKFIFLSRKTCAPDSLQLIFLPIRSGSKSFSRHPSEKIALLAQDMGLPSEIIVTISDLYTTGGLPALQSFFLVDKQEPDRQKDKNKKRVSGLRGLLGKAAATVGEKLAYGLKAAWTWLIDEKQSPPETSDNQTVLLAANPDDYRIALLSEGQPGTPAENEGLRAFLLTDEFVIGRDIKTCDLRLTQPGIGRQHARIVRRSGSFFITDLGSRNGTRLDDQRLLKNTEVLMPERCIVQFADQAFYFQVD